MFDIICAARGNLPPSARVRPRLQVEGGPARHQRGAGAVGRSCATRSRPTSPLRSPPRRSESRRSSCSTRRRSLAGGWANGRAHTRSSFALTRRGTRATRSPLPPPDSCPSTVRRCARSGRDAAARRVPAALGHARGAERGGRRLSERARARVPAYAGRRPGFRTAVARPVSISVGALPPRTCALPGLEPHVDRRRPRTAPVCPATAAHRAVARGRGARRGAGSCGGSGPSRVGARAGEARARAGPTRCARRDPSRVQQAAWSRDSDAGHQRTLPGQAPRLACSPGSLALCVCKKVLARRCV